MINHINIEWKHFDKEGNTCERCSSTGNHLQQAITDLKDGLSKKGITVSFSEKLLSESEIEQSNSILINGILLEDLLADTVSIETPCNSCCEMIGSSVDCRALDCHGQTTEDIPTELIKEAVNNLLRKENI